MHHFSIGPRTITPTLLLVIALCAFARISAAADDCKPRGGVSPICGFQHPEDIEVMAGAWLLVSEYGNLTGSQAGRLTAFVPATDYRRVLFPTADAVGEPDWGASDCPGPPGDAISPHGIHHGPTSDGRVYVVNHAGREAIEIFELADGDNAARARLRWRGCVPAPETAWLNDVVGLPGGGFIATHMVERGISEEALAAAEHDRQAIGHLLRWSREGGWTKVPNSEGGLPNGVEISNDARVVYVNEYFGDRVFALDLQSGQRLWQTPVAAPDNHGWGEDGRLLIASHHEDLHAVEACSAASEQYCPIRYSIVAIDPANGQRQTLVEGGGAPFGGATVAVELDGMLYLGCFVGDRMAATRRGTGLFQAWH